MDTFVRFRDCTCPGTPHAEGDGVTLRPFLGFVAGAQALAAIEACRGDATKLAELIGPVYLREGPESWNVVDEDGPVEYDVDLMLALPFEESSLVVDACDDLYSERVMRPLLRGLNGSSPAGRTATTSATRRSSRKAPKPSRSSSPATSRNGTPTP